MFKWLQKGVKQARDIDAALNLYREDNRKDICRYESKTSDCDLVSQLKEKQSIKKVIEDDIKEHDAFDNNADNIKYILKFLTEVNYRTRNKFNFVLDHSPDFFSTKLISDVLWQFSAADIINLINEIKTISKRRTMLEEKRSALRAIEADIDDIKTKLGIE